MTTTLILGANRGIGLELTRQLSARGDRVIAVCRHTSPALSALPVQTIPGIDLSLPDDLARLDAALGDTFIGQLVFVAGIFTTDTLATLTLEHMRRHFEVNTLAPLAAIQCLKHRLAAGGRIFILSSRVGSITDNRGGGNYAYRVSKAAVNMLGVNMAHDLKPDGIAVILLHPGYVRTDMTGHTGHMDVDESAAGLIRQMDRLGLEDTGSFWHANGERLPW